MIINFSVENWMSFREKAEFSMVASRERQHNERIPRISKYQTRILPVAAIYGGNASGKTNLFQAVSFAKWLVVKGTQPDSLIPIEPFCLDVEGAASPVRFSFELLIDEIIYEFSFAVTRKAVLEEKLVKVLSTCEKVLYHRKNDKIKFDSSLQKDLFLKFAFKGTRENQLFLTNSVSQKVETFKAVYDWFRYRLELVAPDTRFDELEHFLDESNPLYSKMNEILPQLDTGITHLGGEEIPFEDLPIPASLQTRLQEELTEDMAARLQNTLNSESFVVTRKNDKLMAKKLVTYHPKSDGVFYL